MAAIVNAAAGLARLPGRLARDARAFARFVVDAVQMFDEIVPHFRAKTVLVVSMEFVAALAAGVSFTVLVPFVQQLTGGSMSAIPEGIFGDVYRLFGERLNLLAVSIMLCAAVLLKNGLTLLSVTTHTRMAVELSHRLRVRIFSAYIASDLRHFERARDGHFLTVFSQEIPRTEKLLRVWRRSVAGLLNVLVYLTLLVLISPTLTGVLLAVGAFVLLALMRFYYRLRQNGFAVTRLMERVNSRLSEMIRCFVLMKSLGTEEHERSRFAQASREFAEADYRQNVVSLAPGLIIETAAYAVLAAAVTYVHTAFVATGRVNPFIVISYLIFANKLVDATIAVSGTLSQLLQEASAFESTRRALDVRPAQDMRFGTRVLARAPHAIDVEDVSFAHDGQIVLDRCSFSIRAGEVVAIVGASGAGKSTLALLLAGLYRPERGAIRIAGADVAEYSREAVVRAIGYQSQEPRLVEGTIGENLRYGLPSAAGDDAVAAVLRRAHLEDLLEKKSLELEASVGERGGGLSGGERQRLAFARILLRDPDILVLDETTSALDPAAERVLLDTLAALRGTKTIIFITHRLRSASIADRILVLDGGRIVEEGHFADLMARRGTFARLSYRDPVEAGT